MRTAVVLLVMALAGSLWAMALPASAQVAPAATSSSAAPIGGVKQPGKSTLAQDQAAQSAPASFKTPWEVWLTLLTAAMMIAAITVLCVVGWKANFSADFQRTFLIVIIIFASLYLIVAGYSDQQIAPVFSLFGAVIGYLFGKSDAKPIDTRPQETKPRPDGLQPDGVHADG